MYVLLCFLSKQDFSAVKYSLSVQGQNDIQNFPMIITNDKLMNQFNVRLSSVEKDVKVIRDAVSSISFEEKLGRAIESIENKLDQLTTSIYSTQREPVYYTDMQVSWNSYSYS